MESRAIQLVCLPATAIWQIMRICTPAQREILGATCRALRSHNMSWRAIQPHKPVEFLDWVEYGSLAMLKRIKNPSDIILSEAAFRAIDLTYVDIMKWCMRVGISPLALYDRAIAANNIQAMDALYDLHVALNHLVYKSAIRRENIAMMNWLHAHNCPINSDVMYSAVDLYNLEMVDLLINIKCPVGISIYSVAFSHGWYNIIHKLTVGGYSNFETFGDRYSLGRYFAARGSIPTLEYIYSSVDINSDDVSHVQFISELEYFAFHNNVVEIVDWLASRGYKFRRIH